MGVQESRAKWELLVMSYCRARLVTAPRRLEGMKGWEWNPLYRGTDLRRRTIRIGEFVIVVRTDETFGRDEKGDGVHSCNCGVAEKKVLLEWLRVSR